MRKTDGTAIASAEIEQLGTGLYGKVSSKMVEAGRRVLDYVFSGASGDVEFTVIKNFELHEAILAGGLDAVPGIS